MQKTFIVPLFFLFVTLASCHKKTILHSDNKTNPTNTTTKTLADIKSVIIDQNFNVTDTGAAYHIDSAVIRNDILSIFVMYSGGCKKHSFDLFSNGNYAKSLPPQTSVSLKHLNNGDGCRQLISEELKFNVSTLKYSGQNTVIINIGDTQRVYYTIK